MTKNSYLKAAIRSRMELTGEPYSVAAKVVRTLPIPTGWPKLDSAMDGGLRRGSLSSFLVDVDGYFYGTLLNLALGFSLPNRRVLVVCASGWEEDFRAQLLQRAREDFRSRAISKEQLRKAIWKNIDVLYVDRDAEEIAQALEAKSYDLVLIDYRERLLKADVQASKLHGLIDGELTSLKQLAAKSKIPFAIACSIRPRPVRLGMGWNIRTSVPPTVDVAMILDTARSDSPGSYSYQEIGSFQMLKNRFGDSQAEGPLVARSSIEAVPEPDLWS